MMFKKNEKPYFIGVEAFRHLLAAKTVQAGKKIIPLTSLWMNSPKRRTYEGLTFHPSLDYKGKKV